MRYVEVITGRYTSGRGIPFLFSNWQGRKCFMLCGGHCGVLLCANKYVPSDKEDRLCIVSKQEQKVCICLYCTATKISLHYIITIRPHFCAVNTCLFQKEQEKEMDPWNACWLAKLWWISHFSSRIWERWKMILCTILGEYRLLWWNSEYH
jgi:hypothetical protein